MRISGIVIVGPIQRLSYQYNAGLVLENHCQHFDHVYVISSSRETQDLPVRSSKLTFVSEPSTWFQLNDQGEEIFALDQLVANANRMKELATRQGDDFAILIDINQYIAPRNRAGLGTYCAALASEGSAWGYRYRAFQIRDHITYSDMRHPWLFNLRHPDASRVRFAVDAVEEPSGLTRAERGLFIDAPYFLTEIYPPVLTEADYQAKYGYYIRHVHSWYHIKRDTGWEAYVREYNNKANSCTLNPGAELSDWGRAVIANIPVNSIYDRMDFGFANVKADRPASDRAVPPAGRLQRACRKCMEWAREGRARMLRKNE
jgi:hypothetical protein